jgi:hypothetical protein
MRRLLKRSAFCLVPAGLAALALTVPASAGPDGNTSATGATSPVLLALIGNNDVFSTADLTTVLNSTGMTPTQHYGPYASGSPDSGTCGNDWAEDTFDRHFTVRSNGDGTYTVVEQFKNGSFVTNDGASPAACDITYANHGLLIVAGKTGSMHGYFIISDVGTQTSTSSYCDAVAMTNDDCTTTTFINTHFTACYPATCQVTTFFDHYAAGDQSLLFHEWKNASLDRGGNGGDIASG